MDENLGSVIPSFVLMSPSDSKPTKKLLEWPAAWEVPDSDGCEASLEDIPKWFFTRELADDEKGPGAFDKIPWVELNFGEVGSDSNLMKVTKGEQDSETWELQKV